MGVGCRFPIRIYLLQNDYFNLLLLFNFWVTGLDRRSEDSNLAVKSIWKLRRWQCQPDHKRRILSEAQVEKRALTNVSKIQNLLPAQQLLKQGQNVCSRPEKIKPFETNFLYVPVPLPYTSIQCRENNSLHKNKPFISPYSFPTLNVNSSILFTLYSKVFTSVFLP